MPRPKVGPRRLNSKSLVWYAQVVDPVTKKRVSRSLETTNLKLAWERYPEVVLELQRSLPSCPVDPDAIVTVPIFDDQGRVVGEERGRAGDLIPDQCPDILDDSFLTWEKAVEIGAQRRFQKTGSPVSDEWRKTLRIALAHFPDTDPLSLSHDQIRKAHQSMVTKGNQPQTISLKMTAVSSLINTLIRTANTPADYRNPFDRLDFSTSITQSYRTPTPKEYREMWQQSLLKRPDIKIATHIVMYTGCRVMEVLSRDVEHFDPSTLCMSIGKNKQGWTPKNKASYRDIPLPEWLFEEAMEVVGKDTWPCDMKCIRRIAKFAAPDLVTHSLRHGWRTAARQAGADPYSAELYLGHAAGSAMDRLYGVVPLQALQRAAVPTWEVLDQWTARS